MKTFNLLLRIFGTALVCGALAITLLSYPSREVLYREDMHNADLADTSGTEGAIAIAPPASLKYQKRRFIGYGIGALGATLFGFGYFIARREAHYEPKQQ